MSLKDLLIKAKDFHGHICPFLSLGIKASWIAMEKLGVKRGEGTIGEDVIAIVECNNCFADGVQIATGCTFGNNSLIYFDLGKNAVTLAKRNNWKGVRVYVDAEMIREKYFSKEALELFEKVVVRREGSKEDVKRLSELWENLGWKMLEFDDFKVENVKITPFERAPIFESVRCRSCGELVMKTRVKDGMCLSCYGSYYAVVGRGIVKVEGNRFREVIE